MITITITAEQVFSEYLAWLAQQPMSPALEWVLANPPGAEAAQRALSTRRLTHKFMVALYGPACGARATGANAPDWTCARAPGHFPGSLHETTTGGAWGDNTFAPADTS
jgi:hypothetical protein